MAIQGTKSTIMPIELAGQISELSKSVCVIEAQWDGAKSGGTGFLVTPKLILTAAHVVAYDSQKNLPTGSFDIDFNRVSGAVQTGESFLDLAPYPWANSSAGKLHSILADAYPSDGARIAILTRSGIPRSRLFQAGTPYDAWFQALNMAASMGKVRAVIEKVSTDSAVLEYHKQIEELLSLTQKKTAKVTLVDHFLGFAVLELDQEISLPPLTLGSCTEMNSDDGVIIVQHPMLENKSFVLEADGLVRLEEERIFYNVDTTAGSSGAPVFNSQMRVVGIHYAAGGAKPDFENHIILESIVDRSPNVGISIDAVKSKLKLVGMDFLGDSI